MSNKTLIFIGNGMATNRVLENLGPDHPFSEIHIFSDENIAHYNRIMLSPLLAGETTLEAITPHGSDWYRDMRVTIHLANPVTSIDHKARNIVTENGATFSYDALVIASGSRSFIPGVPGSHADNVIGFRAMADVDAMNERLSSIKHATVIGAGLLGVEAAVGLKLQGVNVTLVHRNPVLMNRQLDATAASILEAALIERGIEVRTGCNPVRLTTQTESDIENVNSITLEHAGEEFSYDTDLVVFATGIIPNKEIAESSGIDCGRGIKVNKLMETSSENVFSLGECCEFEGATYGLVAPIWDQATVVAQQLVKRFSPAEQETPYIEREHLTKLKVSGLDIHSIGQFEADAETDVIDLLDRADGVYKKILIKDNCVVGALCVGDVTDSNWYYDLMMDKIPVSSFRSQLIFGKAYCDVA